MRSPLVAFTIYYCISIGCGSTEATTTSSPGGGGFEQQDASYDTSGFVDSSGTAGTAGQDGSAGSGATGGGAGSSGSGGSSGVGGTGASAGFGGSAGNAGGSGGTGGASGQPCTTHDDCPSGNTCQILLDTNQSALEKRCAPLAGPNGTGISCTQSSDCQSGLCIHQRCSAPCSDFHDCTQAGTCKKEMVTLGGIADSFDLCVVLPCANSQACDPGEVCSELQNEGNQLVAYCRQTNAGGSELGSPCTSDGQCASLSCPSWLGFCTEVCSSPMDCDSTSPQACVDVFNNGASIVAACAPSCKRDADCSAGHVCKIATDSASNLHRFICGPGWGSDQVGVSCQTSNSCASGMCLRNYTNGQLVDAICSAPCNTGADCPVGYQVCVDVEMSTPSGGGKQTVRMCNHP
ncbi:MAG TPA: hypothetical protein PKL73_16775 [Polyangiaceae bacterium]|nr:hypothetical protein [Polyangiaceae bacterium]HNZ25467.1 hypothetical protein [Polyangiaceae bacterium]HOD25212.1 hypothetical protein [Polyangiaceae bacterium]HOE51875.1 hypothetical protein [Polyangiaceae bacterium]HOH03687.1 hypothetical protein [Polyangiaceae bacterium]